MNLCSIGCAATVLVLAMTSPSAAFDPTSAYQRLTVEHFTVLLNRELLKHPEERKAALQELKAQARAIARVVPSKPLAALRKVNIWMEWEGTRDGAAEFHPSAGWLQEHGYNPQKAGCIEISNIRNFVKWSQHEQPWMLLHELAHSYHFRVLGEDYLAIPAAYDHAMREKLYDSVDYVNGGKQKAYASTNAKEYFAELTEAYFGRNDFYPFTRSELESYDPVGYRLMVTVWGEPLSDGGIP